MFSTKKLIYIVSVSLAIVLILLLILFIQAPSRKLEVIFFDVGQGDAILLKTPFNQKILIDGGPDKRIIEKLGRALPFYDRQIDLMVLTHPHADHVVGLNEVLKNYQVKKVLATGVIHTTAEYLTWLRIIKEKQIPLHLLNRPQTINLGKDLELEVLHPFSSFHGKTVKDLNETSIVSRLIFKDKKFLLMADASVGTEEELIRRRLDLKADVLKVGHQGSDTSSSEGFLNAVKPAYAVISVGENKFGHPSLRVTKRLEKLGIKVYRTDQDGDIKMVSDGGEIEILGQRF